MAEAVINLKLSPREFDVLRRALSQYSDAKAIESRDDDRRTAKERHDAGVEAGTAADLRDRLA